MRSLGEKVALIYDNDVVFGIIAEIFTKTDLESYHSGYIIQSLGDATRYTHTTQTLVNTNKSRFLVGRESSAPVQTRFPVLDESLGDEIFNLKEENSQLKKEETPDVVVVLAPQKINICQEFYYLSELWWQHA